MNSVKRTIFIISADSKMAHACIDELAALGEHYRTHLVSSPEKACKAFIRTPPSVIFLDQSSIDPRHSG